ncbi:nematode fatty acid retinoid binding protein [Ancylostoma caninum]|uniref:Nematode fatty acid retinoid binding protein n=1 Tax=Ancylostoma caninum TaxID=29170 RepID=A0A368FI70_ANCCA|nr:nematode fatty acid retinoid binding protein [Ancylostoma caninum]
MIRHSIIAVALIALVWAAAIPEVKEEKDKKEEKEIKIPEQYKKLLSHATKHLSKFTPEEKEKLKDFAKKTRKASFSFHNHLHQLSDEKVRAFVKAILAKKFAPDTKEVEVESAEKEKEITIPKQYKELIADHVLKHLANMTPEEKEKLKVVAKKALVWMMGKAKAKLSGKGELTKKILEKKIATLGSEAAKFVVQRLEEGYKFHKAIMAGEKPEKEELKKWAKNTISSYKELSDEAKKEIAKQFPIATALAKNEKLRGIVKALLAKKNAEKKAAEEVKVKKTAEEVKKKA